MTRTLLLVDHNPSELQVLEIMLGGSDYETISTRLGAEAIAIAEQRQPDLILLDPLLKDMDGFKLIKKLKSATCTKNIPIIVLTSIDDRDLRLRGLVTGAEESITKPVDRAELSIRIENLIRLKEYGDILAEKNQLLQMRAEERTGQLADSHHEAISIMTAAAEHKDEDTGLHIERISHYCRELSERMGMDNDFSDCIFYASPMHDIGKVGIPEQILLKPGSYTDAERETMKSHASLGAQILMKGRSPYLRMGARIALSHHERWDGSGYPNGTRGEQIPICARIMNIADQYDALRAKRPYKPALDHLTAMKIITVGDSRTRPDHFDPAVLAAFKRCSKTFDEIYQTHAACHHA